MPSALQLRVLITGVCGFTGRHLVARLRGEWPSPAIYGLDRASRPGLPLDGYLPCDLTADEDVERAVAAACPDVVYHLAGLLGAAAPESIQRVNVGGFENLCRALRRSAAQRGNHAPLRFVTVGSAAELGTAGARRLPATEESPCAPESAYGRSKWATTRLALAEPADSPLQIVVARPFNLIGPGLSEKLALGGFARQLAAVVRGEASAVRTGPLDGRRDFVDVRDAVEALARLAERGRPGQIYNVCSGRSHRIGELLERLADLARVPLRLVVDPAPRRAGDLAEVYGDHAKITREVGWRPAISIDQSLTDLWISTQAA